MADPADIRAWTTQLRKGMAEFCALACLRGGEAYGYALLQRLAAFPAVAVTESTLYPVLNRAAAEGWVRVDMRPSPTGPPRRYYTLTREGEKRLAAMEAAFTAAGDAVRRLTSGTDGGRAP